MALHSPRSETMKFMRYPSDIPVDILRGSVTVCPPQCLRNISFGGLCFTAGAALKKDAVLTVKITAVQPPFRSKARVAWCSHSGKKYTVGVEFVGTRNETRGAMMEQICGIEKYKNDVLRKTGKKLTGEQAADEWRREHDDYLNFLE